MGNVVTVFIKESELSYNKMCLLTVRVWHHHIAGIDTFWLGREQTLQEMDKFVKVLRKKGLVVHYALNVLAGKLFLIAF